MPDTKQTFAKAPLVKKDFTAAKAGPKPDPVSVGELKKNENQRSRPTPAPAPPAPLKAKSRPMDPQKAAQREARIKHIKERLGAQKDRARNDFAKTKQR